MVNFGVINFIKVEQKYKFSPSLFDELEKSFLEKAFYETDLGTLYQAIPFKELASGISNPKWYRSGRGRTPWFNVEGGIALQFLKHYTGLSDHALVKRINTDWALQLFCGIRLGTKRIKDLNIVSAWRCYLAEYLDIPNLQKKFAEYWKPHMSYKHVSMSDATAYESYVRFPTDVKLLWESCQWVYKQIVFICKLRKHRKPRINFKRQEERYTAFQRRRKKGRKKERRLYFSLIRFLGKLLERYDQLAEMYNYEPSCIHDIKRLKTIQKVYSQHKIKLSDPKKKIEDRIVSLGKPYLRPIVRGKETKVVEFGAKVNALQVDGVNFIEHISFDAFHEGNRLKQTVWLHRDLFGTCHQHGADQIYATNENRKYCTKEGIYTCFVQKGKSGKYPEQASALRKELGKQRATVMEGSFGNEKNHYLLNKIKARYNKTEVLWIFFGIMTANAVNISKRMNGKVKRRKAA